MSAKLSKRQMRVLQLYNNNRAFISENTKSSSITFEHDLRNCISSQSLTVSGRTLEPIQHLTEASQITKTTHPLRICAHARSRHPYTENRVQTIDRKTQCRIICISLISANARPHFVISSAHTETHTHTHLSIVSRVPTEVWRVVCVLPVS